MNIYEMESSHINPTDSVNLLAIIDALEAAEKLILRPDTWARLAGNIYILARPRTHPTT